MGTDNLYHRRKARAAEELERKKSKIAPYDRVLIVCEGEKTEPNYFEGLIYHYGLSSANVEITGECGSDPKSIVKHAQCRYQEELGAGNPFDRVYCVFDKDGHDTYTEALVIIENTLPKGIFFTINSVPCFEYWLLLHFEYTTRPYESLPKNSSGNQVLRDLKSYMPGYGKGQKEVFEQLTGQLEYAKANAERALKAAKKSHTDNPSTRVHELVTYLQGIKGEQP